MSAEPYQFRALADPAVRTEATAVFLGLGAAAFVGGSAVAAGAYELAAASAMGVVGTLVGLKHVDTAAREVSA